MSQSIFRAGEILQFRVQLFHHDSSISFPRHVHNESSIVVCTEGSLESVQFGCTEILEPGDVIVTNREIAHSSRYWLGDRRTAGVTIDLDFATLKQIERQFLSEVPISRMLFLGRLHLPRVAERANDIAKEIQAARIGHKLMVDTLALQLIVSVFRDWPSALTQFFSREASVQLPRSALVRSIEAMSEVSDERFSLEKLTSSLHLKPSRFSQLFAKSTGFAPHRFHTQIVMRRAALMLRDGGTSVKYVAHSLGYRTHSHFSAAFKEFWGIAPSQLMSSRAIQNDLLAPGFSPFGEGCSEPIKLGGDSLEEYPDVNPLAADIARYAVQKQAVRRAPISVRDDQ